MFTQTTPSIDGTKETERSLRDEELTCEQLDQVAGGWCAVLVGAAAVGFVAGAAAAGAGLAVGTYLASDGVKAAPDGKGCTEHGRPI
jgi:hypothetical protein